MFSDIVCSDSKQRRLARVLFRKSEVENRHTCVPHQVAYNWCQPTDDETEAERDLTSPPADIPSVAGGKSFGPSTHERMQLYAQFASDLAIEASERALENANCPADTITHLVTVSCTGFDAPGVDIELIQRLGLSGSTQRINVGFMGCHGAINGMRAALGIVKADPNARVLMCAVELCSLHYRFQWDSEGIIGNALFADGSASLVLGQHLPKTQPLHSSTQPPEADETVTPWKLLDTGSLVIPESKQAMSWSVGDHGFEMLLTSEVGERIEQGLAQWLTEWLSQHGVAISEVDFWGVHPGGPRIVSAVQSSLGLSNDSLVTSRSVLQRYGNMSSPTVLFILNEFQKQVALQPVAERKPRRCCVLLAFGPGLVAEVALLATDGNE